MSGSARRKCCCGPAGWLLIYDCGTKAPLMIAGHTYWIEAAKIENADHAYKQGELCIYFPDPPVTTPLDSGRLEGTLTDTGGGCDACAGWLQAYDCTTDAPLMFGGVTYWIEKSKVDVTKSYEMSSSPLLCVNFPMPAVPKPLGPGRLDTLTVHDDCSTCLKLTCGGCTKSPKSWTVTFSGGTACTACQFPTHLTTYTGSIDGTSWTLRPSNPFTGAICTYTTRLSTGPMREIQWPSAGCTGTPTVDATFGIVIQYPAVGNNFIVRAGTVSPGFTLPNDEYFRGTQIFGADCLSARTLTNFIGACSSSQFNGYIGGSAVATPNF